MSVRDVPTRPSRGRRKAATTSIVLLVSAGEELAVRCRRQVFAEGADLLECDLVSLRGSAAWLCPLAIVMTADVRAFDPEGFSELSRRTGAELVVLPSEDIPDAQLAAMLSAAVDLAQRRRIDG